MAHIWNVAVMFVQWHQICVEWHGSWLCTHACTHAYICTLIHAYRLIHFIYACMYTYLSTYIHAYAVACQAVYIHTYIHTYIIHYIETHAWLIQILMLVCLQIYIFTCKTETHAWLIQILMLVCLKNIHIYM